MNNNKLGSYLYACGKARSGSGDLILQRRHILSDEVEFQINFVSESQKLSRCNMSRPQIYPNEQQNFSKNFGAASKIRCFHVTAINFFLWTDELTLRHKFVAAKCGGDKFLRLNSRVSVKILPPHYKFVATCRGDRSNYSSCIAQIWDKNQGSDTFNKNHSSEILPLCARLDAWNIFLINGKKLFYVKI